MSNYKYYNEKSRWKRTAIISSVIAIITFLLCIWLESWQYGATGAVFAMTAFIAGLMAC